MTLPTRPSGGDEVVVDLAVVGSGIAGLVGALDLLELRPELTVALIDKGSAHGSGSTPLAQGGLAAAVGGGDSPELHAADTVRAGDGLCDPRAVAVMAHETPDRVADLRRRGAMFDTDAGGALALAREGGQRIARSVRAADATGAEISRALRESAMAAMQDRPGRLRRLQGTAVDLALHPGPERRASGVWVVLDEVDPGAHSPGQGAGLALVRARAVLLAAGGCGGLYASTTNVDGATGDAVAMAGRAGADLVDLEFIQFHPTGLKAADGEGSTFQRFLLTEALRGAGAHLLDRDGRRFMPDVHPDAELAPRHIVAKAILDQPGGAWLDARMIPPAQMAEEFPTVLAGARGYGFDLAGEPVPVEPCEHYMIGGVATDLHARTTVPGLYAAGEAACTGLHGANRMAGNSLSQSCVFAHRAAHAIAAELVEAARTPDPAPPEPGRDTLPELDLQALRVELRTAMSAGAGAIRDAGGLLATAERLRAARVALDRAWGGRPPLDREAVEVDNLVTTGSALVSSALLREESRGTHWRADHPGPSAAWGRRRLTVRLPGPEERPGGTGR